MKPLVSICFFYIICSTCVSTVSSAPEDYNEFAEAGWFGNPAVSSSSSSSLPPPPAGFGQSQRQQQQQQEILTDCRLKDPLFETPDAYMSRVMQESIIVDGCVLDCGGTIIASAVPDGSTSIIIRNGGHVKNCPLLLMVSSTPTPSRNPPRPGQFDANEYIQGITGFLCDQGDCTLTEVSCNVASPPPLVFMECVLIEKTARRVTITGGLITESDKMVSVYGIVVNAGTSTSSTTIIDDDEDEDSNNKNKNNNNQVQLFVENVRIVNQGFDGIKIVKGAEMVRLTNCQLFNNNDGVEVEGGAGLQFLAIIGGTFQQNRDDGIDISQYVRNEEGSIRDAVVEVFIADVTISLNGQHGILIERVKTVTMDSVSVSGNGRAGIEVRQADVITVQGVLSHNNGHNGLSAEAAGAEITIKNSVFLENGRDGDDGYSSAVGKWKHSGVYIWLPASVEMTQLVANGNRVDGIAIYDAPLVQLTDIDAMRNGEDGIQLRESSEEYGYDYTAGSDFLVGVYYYPWHGNKFHNGGGYLREQLVPPQLPALGEYNDSDPAVIAQHLAWFRKANIGLLVTSWWGPDRIEDTNTREVIMEHENIGNLKIALHYETTGRIKDGTNMTVTRNDIKYMCEHYFNHPNYYKIDNRPVVVIYISRKLHKEGILDEAVLTMKNEAKNCGHTLYLIGDQVFGTAPDQDDQEEENEEEEEEEPFNIPFVYFDAVTNYDVYGSSKSASGSGSGQQLSPYAGTELVDKYYAEQEKWKAVALTENCRFIPAVSPGYNDRGVRLEKDHPPLSRKLNDESEEEGSLFSYQLQKALPLVDPAVDNLILVNSFNEWHEDTQIEPTMTTVSTTTTTQPETLTGGLEYSGYGELYLNILKSQTQKVIEGYGADTIVSSSRVSFTNVHTCANQNDGVSFYITDSDDEEWNTMEGSTSKINELSFTPGGDVVSCQNKRYDYELHGGGHFVFNATSSSSAIVGDTCTNGRGTSDCSAIVINTCDTAAADSDSSSSNQKQKCRHRDIISSSGKILNTDDHSSIQQ